MRANDSAPELTQVLLSLLAQAPLGSAPPARPPAIALVRQRLRQRARASAAAHHEYLTLRHEGYRWLPVGPGVQEQLLRGDARVQVLLWRLEPGAALPAVAHSLGLELLLVQGQLQGPAGQTLNADGYLTLVGADVASATEWRAVQPSLVYGRSRHAELAAMPTLEAHWWQLAAQQSGRVTAGPWLERRPLVQVLPLCGDASVTSALVRFQPGGVVPDHVHSLDEDCLVLSGEMFLGDILLRALDYQLAPAGGSHFGETSDVGVCFFFHGSIDPALRR